MTLGIPLLAAQDKRFDIVIGRVTDAFDETAPEDLQTGRDVFAIA